MNNEINEILKRLKEVRTKPLNPLKYMIVGLLVSIGFLLLNYFVATNMSKPGEFGDMFGVSNAAFSGLALAAVAYSIYAQSRELKLQGDATLISLQELKESVEAQKGSTEAQREQAQIQEQQVLAIKEQIKVQNQQVLAMNEQTDAQIKQMEIMYRQIEAQNTQSKILLNETLINVYLEDIKLSQDVSGYKKQLIDLKLQNRQQGVQVKKSKLNSLIEEALTIKKNIDSIQ